MQKIIAVYDASGLIGHEILNCLADDTQSSQPTVIALSSSSRAIGRTVSFGDRDIPLQSIETFDFSKCDLFIHADRHPVSIGYIDLALKSGCKVIDACGHCLLQNDKTRSGQMISLPSAIGGQIIAALRPLHAVAKIKRVVVSTYQAASGEEKEGMDELFNQSRKFFTHDSIETQVFQKQLAFNVIPQIDEFMSDGQTQAEWRIAAEIKALLDPAIKISATCVQVPVFIGHSASVLVEFDEAADDMDAKTARNLWRDNDDIIVIDTDSDMQFVTPSDIAGEDSLFISRVRNDISVDNGLSFWCAADNVRAFAALKAVEAISKIIS